MPRKELFEVFQSQGVPINDGKYSAPPTPEAEEVSTNEVAPPVSAPKSARQDTAVRADASVYTLRKDTAVWLVILVVLAIALSFLLGLTIGKRSTVPPADIAKRSVESLEIAPPVQKRVVQKVRKPKPVVKPKGKYALQIITYPNTSHWRAKAAQLVKILQKKGLDTSSKRSGKKLVILVGHYNSKNDARLASDKAVLSKIKIQNSYPFKKPLIVKR